MIRIASYYSVLMNLGITMSQQKPIRKRVYHTDIRTLNASVQCCYQDQTFQDQDQNQKVQDQDHSFQDQDQKVQDQDLASSNKVNATTER